MLLGCWVKITICCTLLAPAIALALQPPVLQSNLQETQVTLSWSAINDATGYHLSYAPYPYLGAESIQTIDLALNTEFSAQLWNGAAFYVAVQSYRSNEISQYSNIELIKIDTSATNLPSGIVMKNISGGTFIMGNNSLLGPQTGEATEHQVTLSDFAMSETEITNSQYVEFLNAAYAQGFIVISIGSSGGDQGKSLIVGSSSSAYQDKVLYDLSGTRVMKDHDNADADNDAFTGDIEPENPLNIAFIGFDAESQQFYLKDPHNPDDFNWQELTSYYDYSTRSHQLDTSQQLNDFGQWSELNGWTAEKPEEATGLPTKSAVGDYPVTFVRWWGAFAFADFYGVKLPSEAQWEYAAKGGEDFFYAVYDGQSVSDANWNQEQFNPALHHVRQAKSGQPNPFGLYNLGGNVWEWIADHYQAYSSASVTDPLIEIEGSTTRVWRGGSWNYHQATLESSGRFYDDENRGNDHFGFRIAR